MAWDICRICEEAAVCVLPFFLKNLFCTTLNRLMSAPTHVERTCGRISKHRVTDETEEKFSLLSGCSYLLTPEICKQSENCQNGLLNFALHTAGQHDSSAIHRRLVHNFVQSGRRLWRCNIYPHLYRESRLLWMSQLARILGHASTYGHNR